MYRNYYVWSDTPERYKDARIIFQDFEPSNWSFDPLAKAYYFHRFYSHQPDLNYNNPSVIREIRKSTWFCLCMCVLCLLLDPAPLLSIPQRTMSATLTQHNAF